MDRPEPRIKSADVLTNGILISFDDGKCALYSTELLRAALPDATEIDESQSEDE